MKKNTKNTANNIDLFTFRGTWKILDERGKFLAWATGTVRDAMMLAKEMGFTYCEFIPCDSSLY